MLDRRFVFLFIFSLPMFSLFAQENKFSLGLTYQPFFYENYNKSDWNNRPRSYPVTPENFNGQAFGIVAGIPLSDFVTAKIEGTYSTQSQNHKIVTNGDSIPGGGIKYYYGASVHSKFEIIKLPIMVAFEYEIGINSGLYINGYLGGQLSYVNSYSSEFTQYYFDVVDREIDMDFVTNYISRTPKLNEQVIWDDQINPPGYRENNFDTDFLYNRWLLGVLGGVEFQKKIASTFLFGIGGRIEYDFTNSEKYPEWRFEGLGGLGDRGPRAKSHNIRYGLTLSATYLFTY